MMRVLCLHGRGTNNKVFEIQTAPTRYALGEQYAFDFVNGSLDWPQADEIKHLFPPTDSYYALIDPDVDQTKFDCFDALRTYIVSEGPFDIIMGFSQGAAVAASFIAQEVMLDPTSLSFKGAIFFCGGTPFIADDTVTGFRKLDAEIDGAVIQIPTAHIIGQNDGQFTESIGLKELCAKDRRWDYVHEGTHEIPSGKSDLRRMVDIITNVCDAAFLAQ